MSKSAEGHPSPLPAILYTSVAVGGHWPQEVLLSKEGT